MSKNTDKVNVLITSYLEPEHVERIRQVDARLDVIYRPDLIPSPRFAADHTGPAKNLSDKQEIEWRKLLNEAEILFDFDFHRKEILPELTPNLRWIQATSAGIGQFVNRLNYAERMPGVIFTTASGVHARPLAEFVIMSMIMHYKGFMRIIEDKRNHHWERYAGTDLENRTMGLVGLGRIGSQVANFARALGMKVIGTNSQSVENVVDEFYEPSNLKDMLPKCDVLVLTVPHTPETEKMIGKNELSLLPDNAFLVNIARGMVVDEEALIEVLKSGKLGGAALDVFAEEPLPQASPLWDMPNVLISPHSASTSDRENLRITDLFVDNLQRYLSGQQLRNVLNVKLMY